MSGKVKSSKLKSMFHIRLFFEQNGLGVCSIIGKFLGLRVKKIRLFFIYLSLFTIFIGPILYLILAFFIKIKNIFFYSKSSAFDI